MIGITVLLLAAALGFGVSHRFQLPSIPLLILAGVAAGAVLPLPEADLEGALVLGVTVMVFVAGMELSPGRVRGQRTAALLVGVGQFLLLGTIGAAIGHLLGYPIETVAYLALALTASSTLVVVRLLQSKQQLFEPFGRLVTGVLLLQDLLVVLLIPVVTRLTEGAIEIAIGLLYTLVLVVLAGCVLRWLAPWIVRRLEGEEEELLLVSLAILFAFLGLAQAFRLPLVSGAFLAGLSLSQFPVGALVRGGMGSISDFFGAVFFTALGAFLPFPSGSALVHSLLFAAIVIIATPPIVASLAERGGFSARPALAAGLLLAQTSEFSLVVGLQGVVAGQISDEVFGMIALTTLLTMVVTPLLATDRVTWALVHRHPFRKKAEPAAVPEGHILLVGGGRNGGDVLEILVMNARRAMVVDDDPGLILRYQEAEVDGVRGDATDLRVLRAAGADRARAVVSTIRRREDNEPLLTFAAEKVPVFVRAFNVEDADWIRERNGRPILYSEAALQDFMEWYDGEWVDRNSELYPL